MSTIIWLSIASLLFLASAIVYRLYLHPLAGVPGPKLAALTSWYEFYYDCVLGGKYCFKIDELHKQYGEFGAIKRTHIPSHSHWLTSDNRLLCSHQSLGSPHQRSSILGRPLLQQYETGQGQLVL